MFTKVPHNWVAKPLWGRGRIDGHAFLCIYNVEHSAGLAGVTAAGTAPQYTISGHHAKLHVAVSFNPCNSTREVGAISLHLIGEETEA